MTIRDLIAHMLVGTFKRTGPQRWADDIADWAEWDAIDADGNRFTARDWQDHVDMLTEEGPAAIPQHSRGPRETTAYTVTFMASRAVSGRVGAEYSFAVQASDPDDAVDRAWVKAHRAPAWLFSRLSEPLDRELITRIHGGGFALDLTRSCPVCANDAPELAILCGTCRGIGRLPVHVPDPTCTVCHGAGGTPVPVPCDGCTGPAIRAAWAGAPGIGW